MITFTVVNSTLDHELYCLPYVYMVYMYTLEPWGVSCGVGILLLYYFVSVLYSSLPDVVVSDVSFF